MWNSLRELITSAKDALGVEIPGVDAIQSLSEPLTSGSDSVTGAAQSAADQVGQAGAAVAEPLSTAAGEATASVADVSRTANVKR